MLAMCLPVLKNLVKTSVLRVKRYVGRKNTNQPPTRMSLGILPIY